ncbi:MAG: hypothetical protein QM572_16195 [Nocardioides sp.]|uniref:RCC1 domain-containing protein n=1 Tax=Nocardioides sp. TaxID=35761 RepID=UPI0039E4FD87
MPPVVTWVTTYRAFTALASGPTALHTLASVGGVAAYAWGAGGNSTLGNGSTANRNVPTAVSTAGVLNGVVVTALAAGEGHSLALSGTGTVYAWGRGDSGRLGDGADVDRSTPVAVDTSGVLSGRQVTAIAAGGSHSLAVDSAGQVYAWGRAVSGRLGIGPTDPGYYARSPMSVALTATRIAAGSGHSLALDPGGAVWAWGSGSSGALGNGSTADADAPVAVDTSGALAGRTIVAVAAGTSHSLALDSTGRVYAWGAAADGQLGSGSTTGTSVPVAVDASGVLAGKTIVAVAAGGGHSLALDSEGRVYAWGNGANGQLGDGTDGSGPRPLAVAVDTSGVLAGRSVVAIAAGNIHSLAIDSDGHAFAWGNDGYGQLGNGAFGAGGHSYATVPVAVDVSGL